MTDTAQQTRYQVEGMDCPSCAAKIETALGRLPGVEQVSVSLAAGTLTVLHQPQAQLAPAIARRVSDLGFAITLLDPRPAAADQAAPAACACCHDHHHPEPGAATPAPAPADATPWWQSPKSRLTAACGAALVLAWGLGQLVPGWQGWGYPLAMLVGLVPIARRALAAARTGTPFSIEMLMTLAAVGAVVIGAGEEAAAVVFLFLVGELLEGVAAGRARAGIQALTALMPRTALIERNGTTEEVPAATLAVGALILVRPGERIPADGVIVAGHSAIDQAPVTGESTPVRKGPDERVFAGTVNGEAALRVRVTAAAADNTIARIVKLVEQAQESKAPTERLIDRFARAYTPAIVALAALVTLAPPLVLGGDWGEWFYKGLAILLIGCPCALVISTPAAIAAGLSAGARRGLLIKGGAVLENLQRVTTAAFDKTGTLTEGRPQVTEVIGLARPEAEVLALAAALETGSSHPLARAILERATAAGVSLPPASELAALGGRGIRGRIDGAEVFLGSLQAASERAPLTPAAQARVAALTDQGQTVSVLVVGGVAAGLLALSDQPRADAREGLERLRRAGVRPLMLTGDSRRTAAGIGRQLGLEVEAELLPEDKQRIVRQLQQTGQTVAVIGDGINDAPALASADIGIAMGNGTDVALETADAAVLHGRVGDVAALIALSRRTMANIRQNLILALGLKAVFLITTVAGLTGLWPAILADTGATVLVTANALRLLALRL